MFSVQWSIMLTHKDLNRVQCSVCTNDGLPHLVIIPWFCCYSFATQKKLKTKHTLLMIWFDCCFSSNKSSTTGWHVFPYILYKLNSIRYIHYWIDPLIGMAKRTHFPFSTILLYENERKYLEDAIIIIIYLFFVIGWAIGNRWYRRTRKLECRKQACIWLWDYALCSSGFLLYYWFWWFDGVYPGTFFSEPKLGLCIPWRARKELKISSSSSSSSP